MKGQYLFAGEFFKKLIRICRAAFITLVLLASIFSPQAMGGGDSFSTGILASLSLLTRYHVAIIWALLELEARHPSIEFDQNWYYSMWIRKPAQRPQEQNQSEVSPNLPGLSLFAASQVVSREYPGKTSVAGISQGFDFTGDSSAPVVAPVSMPVSTNFIGPVLRSKAHEQVCVSITVPENGKDEELKKRKERAQEKLRKQIQNGRDPDLTFFVKMISDLFNQDPETEARERSVTPDCSESPYGSWPESPCTPPPPESASRRKSLQREVIEKGRKSSIKDGFFIGDKTKQGVKALVVEQEWISKLHTPARFGREYSAHQYEASDFTAGAKETRGYDFLEIKFRVLCEKPKYEFALKKGMVCNVYERGNLFYELCVPYRQPPSASLSEMNEGRYVPAERGTVPEAQYLNRLRQDQSIMQLLKGFEREIGIIGSRLFTEKELKISVNDSQGRENVFNCIGHGQCAAVWRLGDLKLAMRRYGRHTYTSAMEQAAIQQASHSIYEQLAYARGAQNKLKLLEEIGLPQPMSIVSTRVLSQYEVLPSLDGSYALYEIQPLIPDDELVEKYLSRFAATMRDSELKFRQYCTIPLYDSEVITGGRVSSSLHLINEVWTEILEGILQQLLIVSQNLDEYRQAHESNQLLGIGIDPKIGNYQVRFIEMIHPDSPRQFKAFLANYDGYPPNLTLFNQKSVLFKGGPLYDLLNEFFSGFGFTDQFVSRSIKLTTLQQQALKMLASIATDTEKVDPKLNVLQYSLEIVNRWLLDNKLVEGVEFQLTKLDVQGYRQKSSRYHKAVRLHLLAAEIGAGVDPDHYSIPSTEFPVNQEQKDWLQRIRRHFTLHIMAFFHLGQKEKLEQLLLALLDDDISRLPTDMRQVLEKVDQLIQKDGATVLQMVGERDYAALMELLMDAFAQSELNPADVLWEGRSSALPEDLQRCGLTGSCSYSRREHQIYHLWLERFFLFRILPMQGLPMREQPVREQPVREQPDTALRVEDEHNAPLNKEGLTQWLLKQGLAMASQHTSSLSVLAHLLRIPEDRAISALRNALSRGKNKRWVRQMENAQVLEELLKELSEHFKLGEKNPHRNILLLNSLLLDRNFVLIQPTVNTLGTFLIKDYELRVAANDDETSLRLELNETILNEAQLADLITDIRSGTCSARYFIYQGTKDDLYILRPVGMAEAEEERLGDPDENISPLLTGIINNMNQPDFPSSPSNFSLERVNAYREALRNMMDSYGYVYLPPPPVDHHCIFQALAAYLRCYGYHNVTKDQVMLRLRNYIAKLLLKIALNRQQLSPMSIDDLLTPPEVALFNLGVGTLLEMLEEMAVPEDVLQGPSYVGSEYQVWAHQNTFFLAAQAFNISIPYTLFNQLNNGVIEHHVAQPDGFVSFVDFNQPPPAMIVFGQHLNHWELVVPHHLEATVTPILPWVQQQPLHNLQFDMDSMQQQHSMPLGDDMGIDFPGFTGVEQMELDEALSESSASGNASSQANETERLPVPQIEILDNPFYELLDSHQISF